MDLRPQSTITVGPKILFDDNSFVFSRYPLIVNNNDAPSDSGDETDPEDHEARIRSSWHHRALLGDENRIRYDDFQDTDFDALQKDFDNATQEKDEADDVVVF